MDPEMFNQLKAIEDQSVESQPSTILVVSTCCIDHMKLKYLIESIHRDY